LSFAASRELALPRERHAGEGLVDLDPVEVLDRTRARSSARRVAGMTPSS
jgi:hypothetical protein